MNGTRAWFCLLVTCLVPVATAQTYRAEQPVAAGSVEPRAINASGVVAGSSAAGLFIYEGTTLTHVGTLGGQPVTVRGINAAKQVVGLLGNTFVTPSPLRGFYWSTATGMLDIGSLQVGGRAEARAINNAGQVVGISYPGLFPLGGRAFLWTLGGGMVDLGTLGGGGAAAMAINSGGEIVGTSPTALGQPHAFVWRPGEGMLDLGTLGGTTSSASDINDSGHVVGTSTNASGQNRAYLWTPSAGMVDLGGVGNCSAARINNLGHVLGQCARPFVWTPESGLIDLAFGEFNFALSMNNAGTVVGGVLLGGQFRSFIYDAAGGIRDLGQHLADQTLLITRAEAIGDDGTIAVHLLPSFELLILRLESAPGFTPTGTDVKVEVAAALPEGGTVPVAITFANVTSDGNTSITLSASGPTPPAGFKLGEPPLVYEVTTDATFGGSVELCFSWVEGQFANESAIALFHFDGGAWVDITTSVDMLANKVCGTSMTLSPFALMEISFAFEGFYQPVGNPPLYNATRAGGAVPIKFSLGGFRGLDVVAAGYPASTPVECGSSTGTTIAEEISVAGASALAYDPATDQYRYVWKTEKGWAGTCRQLLIRLTDGTIARANFEFR